MGAFMGQPARNQVMEQWIGKNIMATISQDSISIIDLNKKKFYMVMPQQKSYIETDLPVDFMKLMPAQAQAMMKNTANSMSFSVTPNNQTKKVGNWNTKGYNVSMNMMGMQTKMTMWASTDVPFDWKGMSSMYMELVKSQLKLTEQSMKEFQKIQGFVVLTEVEVMGMKSVTTVIEINPNKAPAPGVYTVPAGYTKKTTF